MNYAIKNNQSLPKHLDAVPSEQSHDMDGWISLLLRGGVLISLAFVIVGTVLTFLHNPSYLTSSTALPQLSNPQPDVVPHTVAQIAEMVRAGQGKGFVALGLLVLIATPVLRVALSVVTFWLEKDRSFVIITATVFCLLILSLLLGKVE